MTLSAHLHILCFRKMNFWNNCIPTTWNRSICIASLLNEGKYVCNKKNVTLWHCLLRVIIINCRRSNKSTALPSRETPNISGNVPKIGYIFAPGILLIYRPMRTVLAHRRSKYIAGMHSRNTHRKSVVIDSIAMSLQMKFCKWINSLIENKDFKLIQKQKTKYKWEIKHELCYNNI